MTERSAFRSEWALSHCRQFLRVRSLPPITCLEEVTLTRRTEMQKLESVKQLQDHIWDLVYEWCRSEMRAPRQQAQLLSDVTIDELDRTARRTEYIKARLKGARSPKSHTKEHEASLLTSERLRALHEAIQLWAQREMRLTRKRSATVALNLVDVLKNDNAPLFLRRGRRRPIHLKSS